MRWLTNCYDFRFNWTATAAIGIHPTNAWLSQLVNFKNAIWHFGKNATETYGMLETAFQPSCMNQASVFEWNKRFKEGRESVRDNERCGRSKEVNTPQLIGQRLRVRVTMLRFLGSLARDSIGRGQHSSNRVSGISTRTMHQSTTPSLSLTIWPRWASRQFLSLRIVQTLLPVIFGYSLSWEAVIMRQLRKWKRLWQRSLTRSHKRTSMGPSRSCWNGKTSALQPEEITSKGTRVSCVNYQWKCPYKKVWKLIVWTSYILNQLLFKSSSKVISSTLTNPKQYSDIVSSSQFWNPQYDLTSRNTGVVPGIFLIINLFSE